MTDSNRWLGLLLIVLVGLQAEPLSAQNQMPPPPPRGARLADTSPATPISAEEPRADDPDLLLWLDATDRSTITLADDLKVSSWTNKATQVGHAFTADGDARPLWAENRLNGHPALCFDGQNDVLSCVDFGQSASQWTLLLAVVPQSNRGTGIPDGFHAFLSANTPRQLDFVTGLNVDMGAVQTERFECLNVEGAAGGGATNLLFSMTDFSVPRVLAISTGSELTSLWAESIPQGSRPASESVTSLAEMRIGARYYFQNRATGFAHADIAELLLYRGALPEPRVLALSKYLESKYGVQAVSSTASHYTLEQALTALASYDWGDPRAALAPIDAVIRGADRQAIAQLEGQLLQVLQQGVPSGSVDFICRRLAVIGSSESVEPLAALLQDELRYRPAVAALEQLPDPAAAARLAECLPRATGDVQLAIIRAVGQRHEVAAVDELLNLLSSSNPDTSQAAAAALAEIAEPRTCPTLIAAWQDKPQLLLRLADRLTQRSERQLAATIYESLAHCPDESAQAAALAGSVASMPDRSVILLLAALRSGETRRVGHAAQLLAHTCPEETVRQVLNQFAEFTPTVQQTLLGMRWTHLPEVGRQLGRQGIAQTDLDTVAAALPLLVLCGDRSDVTALSHIAAGSLNEALAASAQLALRHLSAPGTDEELVRGLKAADMPRQLVLIRAIRDRRTTSAGGALLELASSQHGPLRLEALRALEAVGDAAAVEPLITILLSSQDPSERDAAERAAWQCASRAEPASRSRVALEAFAKVLPGERALLLPLLGRLGGNEVLPVVQEAQTSEDSAVRDAAVRALANWPDASVAEQLLAIVRQDSQPTHRIWALRGYVRVVTLPGARTPQETLQMLHTAWSLAERTDEKRLILQRLAAVPCPESLQLAVDQLEQTDLKQDAMASAATLAEALTASSPELARIAMEKVVAATNDPVLRERLQRHLNQNR